MDRPVFYTVSLVSSVAPTAGFQLEGAIHGVCVPFLMDTGAAVMVLDGGLAVMEARHLQYTAVRECL